MGNFKKLFSRTIYLLVPLALTAVLANSDKVNQGMAKLIVPPFTELQPSSDGPTKAELLRACQSRTPVEHYVFNGCTISPGDVAIANRMIGEQHRRHYDNQVSDLAGQVQNFEYGTMAALSLLLIILFGFNVCQVYLKPLVLRVTAPARSRNIEQEFLRLKMLHENGVLTDPEFAAKKESLRAKVMAES